MDAYFDTVVSQAERSEVEHWIAANDSDEVEFIAIEIDLVTVRGRKNQFAGVSGTARRRGALAHDLDEALAMMRAERDAQP